MTYVINSVSKHEDTITTNVTYTLSNQQVTVDVTHFRPATVADVTFGIENRGNSEQAKIDAIAICNDVYIQLTSN